MESIDIHQLIYDEIILLKTNIIYLFNTYNVKWVFIKS
ncbi:protein of unknown function [Tenacibaculum sp. 190524A02b]